MAKIMRFFPWGWQENEGNTMAMGKTHGNCSYSSNSKLFKKINRLTSIYFL